MQELNFIWQRVFKFNWVFALVLVFVVCITRFFLVLDANQSGSYGLIGIVMMISAITPFLFLTKYGRRQIGMVKPKNYFALLIAFVSGLIFSSLLHYIAQGLYDSTYQNWYVYIGKSYNIPAIISQHDKAVLFAVMAFTGMIFSPIGEELFFRGIVHSAFAKSIGNAKASIADSAAFALTHISHFGLVYLNSQWDFFTVPALLWVIGMFLVSLMFFVFKKYSGSLLGAILCHAGFNLGMIYAIFYML
jgi:membrane protease YdiL (CAAX protease family)